MENELTGGDEPKGEQTTNSILESADPLKRKRIGLIKYSKYFRIWNEGKTMHLNAQQKRQRCATLCVCSGNQLLKPAGLGVMAAAGKLCKGVCLAPACQPLLTFFWSSQLDAECFLWPMSNLGQPESLYK